MKRVLAWMFSGPQASEGALRRVWWWEARRIPFNVVIGLWGVVCLIGFIWGISAHLPPGEDAVEPIALLAAPFVINALYTLGWIVEIPLRWMRPSTSLRLGPLLLAWGFAAGMIPGFLLAVFWVGYRLAH